MALPEPVRLRRGVAVGVAVAPGTFGAARPCSGLLQCCLCQAGELPPASHMPGPHVAALLWQLLCAPCLQALPHLGEGCPCRDNTHVVPSTPSGPVPPPAALPKAGRHLWLQSVVKGAPGPRVLCFAGPWGGQGIAEVSSGSLDSCTAYCGHRWPRLRARLWAAVPLPACPPHVPSACLSSVTGNRSAVTTSSESHSRLQE